MSVQCCMLMVVCTC